MSNSRLIKVFIASIMFFQIFPILAIIPLSFNSIPYFTYPMEGFSLRWYADVLGSGEIARQWQRAFYNSLIVGTSSAALSIVLGTSAAIGLNDLGPRMKNAMTSFFIAPIVVPTVVTATGIFYFYSRLGMVGNLIGLIVAHTAICVPFVVLSVSSSLARFDRRLSDAAASLGASPSKAFYTVTLPAISPGIWTGAILAFVTSWDEVVLAMFLAGPEQHTVPRRMWSGLREYISPAIIAVATILIMLSIGLLAITQWIQSRNDRRHAAAATE